MPKAQRKKKPEQDPAEDQALAAMVDFLNSGGAERLPEADYQRRRSRLAELLKMGDAAWALEIYESELGKERKNQ